MKPNKPKKKEVVVTKVIVETTGNFGLLNTTGEYIESTRPSVTTLTTFIEGRQTRGDVKIRAHGLPKKANDLEFKGFIDECKGDLQMAIDSYCAFYGQDRGGDPVETETGSETAAEKAAREAEEAQRVADAEEAQRVADKAKAEKEAADLAEKEAAEEAALEAEENELKDETNA